VAAAHLLHCPSFALLASLMLSARPARTLTAQPVALQIPVQLEAFAARHRRLLRSPAVHAVFADHVSHLVRAALISPWHGAHCFQLVKGGTFAVSAAAAMPLAEPALPPAAPATALAAAEATVPGSAGDALGRADAQAGAGIDVAVGGVWGAELADPAPCKAACGAPEPHEVEA
jgi:hypothetical protein